MRRRIQTSKTRPHERARFERKRLRALTTAAMFAALLCLVCPWSIPVGAVPISLALFVLTVTARLLPLHLSLGATLLYLAIGCIGLPVFSGFGAGMGVLIGPTGGFLIAYLPFVCLIGLSAQPQKRWVRLLLTAAALVLCYAIGTAWYMLVTDTESIASALAVCVLPFVLSDAAKVVLGCVISHPMRARTRGF